MNFNMLRFHYISDGIDEPIVERAEQVYNIIDKEFGEKTANDLFLTPQKSLGGKIAVNLINDKKIEDLYTGFSYLINDKL